MLKSGDNWRIPFFDFVDEFRRTKNYSLIETEFSLDSEHFDSLLASTIEFLCAELEFKTPNWIWEVPPCKDPWFVSGYENLKAISLVESPVFFRRRKIFVLKNFLDRA